MDNNYKIAKKRRNNLVHKERPSTCWSFYIIRTDDGSLYAGITTDVQRRYCEHVSQGRKSAKYLLAHKPQCLIMSQSIGSRSLALKVEHCFKRLSKRDKESIVISQVLPFDQKTGTIQRRNIHKNKTLIK